MDLPFLFAEDQAAGAAQTQMQTLRLGLVALLPRSTAATAGVRTSRRVGGARSGGGRGGRRGGGLRTGDATGGGSSVRPRVPGGTGVGGFRACGITTGVVERAVTLRGDGVWPRPWWAVACSRSLGFGGAQKRGAICVLAVKLYQLVVVAEVGVELVG